MKASLPLNTRAGFTITELVIVMAVILILLSIFMPWANRAHEMSDLAACGTNLRRVGLDIEGYMVDNQRRFPTVGAIVGTFSPDDLLCPSDKDPYKLGAAITGAKSPRPISYGFNAEYPAYELRYGQAVPGGKRAVAYDALISAPGGGEGANVTVCRVPAGNPDGSQTLTVGASEVMGYLAEGGYLGRCQPGDGAFKPFDIGDSVFTPRHDLKGGVGNVLYADWHVESHEALRPSMFVFPEGRDRE
ncbi:MAG: prepilin-type N-terminal cleavage/methylation domain-containing protein [Phycisphaera sp.]|nr:prepilin-type N-terminal cleavage/methylation domain-containing protein [Phycisphaera sp.]